MIVTILNVVGKLVLKHTWKRLFPKYTKDEYKRKVAEKIHETRLHTDRGEYRKAVNARRKRAQYQLKIMKITYDEDIRYIREKCKGVKKTKKV